MKKPTRYPPEFRERAVRMLLEQQDQYDSQCSDEFDRSNNRLHSGDAAQTTEQKLFE